MQKRNRDKEGRILAELVGDINGTYFTYLRRKARERGLEFSVSKQFLWDLYLKQEGKCALSGVPLMISTKLIGNNSTGKRVDKEGHTASLDRIDNSIGYVEGNLQWVHKTVNRMRRQYSVEEYLNWCKLVANHANIEPSPVNATKVAGKVQRLEGEEATNNPSTSAEHSFIFHYCHPLRPCLICDDNNSRNEDIV